MERILQDWVKELKQVLGTNLVSVILYGSTVRNEHVPARSDVNLMLMFKKIDLGLLTNIKKLTHRRLRKQMPHLVFWTEREFENAWDVFPLEFEDIKENHQCLLGKNPFLKRKVDKRHMRYQLEFELRSKLLNIRDTWLRLNRNKYELEMYLVRAGHSFEYLIRKAEAVFGKKIKTPSHIFEEIKRVRKKELRPKRKELQHLFHQLHETVESVITKIDTV
jgi:predicted nucleotidyltransferase